MSDCNLCCKVLSTLEHSSRALTQAWSPASDKMLDLLRGLKSLVKLSHVQIDSSIFRLHYVRIPANMSPITTLSPLLQTITVMACLAFSLLVTARQYVGNPIDCVHTKDIPEVGQHYLYNYLKTYLPAGRPFLSTLYCPHDCMTPGSPMSPLSYH